MRAFTAAALQIAPVPGPLSPDSVKANIDRCVDWLTRCVEATGAELVVLPESATTGFTPDCSPEELWDLVTELPGAVIEPIQAAAATLGVHVCVGTYERGAERGVVYNSSALIGPDGALLGVYRKTHPFCTEIRARGGWVTPGDQVTVVDTELGRIGMIICFDGDYPELTRHPGGAGRGGHLPPLGPAAQRRPLGADVASPRVRQPRLRDRGQRHRHRPRRGAVLRQLAHRHADRAHRRQGGQPRELGERPPRPAEALSSLTPGSSVGQGFDHLADRNLDLIRNYRDDLERPAATSFPHLVVGQ